MQKCYVALHKRMLQCAISLCRQTACKFGTAPQPTEAMMSEHIGKEIFSQAGRFFQTARLPEQMQTLIQDGVGRSREMYGKAAAATQESNKVLTDLAETTWSSTKMLNDKAIQNAAANVEATFEAAAAVAKATSLVEIMQVQSRFMQEFTSSVTAQSKEFYDLSARAVQLVFEAAQTTASKSLKAGL